MKNAKSMFKSKYFWLGVFGIIIISCLSLYIIAGDVFRYKRGYLNLFVFANINSIYVLDFILPILPICALIGEKKLHKDNNSFTLAIYGPAMVGIAFIIELILFILIDPTQKEVLNITGLYSNVFNISPIGYILCFIFHNCLWSYAFTLFGISIGMNDHFNAVIYPLLLSRISTYIPSVFNGKRIFILEYLLPQLPFNISQMSENIIANLSQVIFVIWISIIIIYKKTKKEIEYEKQ